MSDHPARASRRLGRFVACVGLAVPLSISAVSQAAAATPAQITTISGTIAAGAPGDTQPLKLSGAQVTAGVTGRVLVAVTAHSPASLNPGMVRVTTTSGNPLPTLVSRADLAGSPDGYAVARLAIGTSYRVELKAQGQTSGAYVHSVTLAGDVDGNATVTATDVTAILKLLGVKAGHPRYVAGADVDGNGRIALDDSVLAGLNLNSRVKATPPPPEPINPLDQFLDAGALTIEGITPKGFNQHGTTAVVFRLTGDTFSQNPADTVVMRDGGADPDTPLFPEWITVTSNAVIVSADAVYGTRNLFKLTSMDSHGRKLYKQAEFWAGSGSLTVRLVDSAGAPITQAANVTLTLADDITVRATAPTSTGQVTFENLPDRTFTIDAKSGAVEGSAGGTLLDSPITITLDGVGAPSSVDNNDFSLGLDGWQIGATTAQLVEHVEAVGPGGTTPLSARAAPSVSSRPQSRPQRDRQQVSPATSAAGRQQARMAAAIVDQDLQLSTAAEGEVSVSRTFNTDPGVSAVRLRYRFVTSEVPGGYFGTKYNDYFRVSVRSGKGAGTASESNSMNGLGLAAFDASGSTAWRDVTLKTDEAGDTIEVSAAVANVADDLLDSQVIVDFVEEIKVRVLPTLSWNAATGGIDLRYTVEGGEVQTARDITVQFATGTAPANRVGAVLLTQNVPAQTAVGSYGPFHIVGNQLANDPAGITHVVAASNAADYGSLADAQINYGPQADPTVVSAGMIDVVKDSLREAGQAQATIQSTARTPTDQARAMFNNLTNPNNTIQQNVNNQLGIYAPPGDAVINRFVTETAGMTPAQIQANAPAIRTAMEAEINTQGCPNVSRHCADPTLISVVDVGAAAFTANNGPIFAAAAGARAQLINEVGTNNCYHLEL